MDRTDLNAVAREQSDAAAAVGSGRSAVTLFGGRASTLRQTVVALRSGVQMSEHENPGEATLQVLSGRVRIVGESGDSAEGAAGALLVIPDERHRLESLEDSVVLLTVAKL